MDERNWQAEYEKAKQTCRVILLCMLAAAALIVGLFAHYKAQRHFTTDKWLADPDHRYRLVGDLTRRYGLEGMSEDEVYALLGTDTAERWTFKTHHTPYPQESTLVYYLGVPQIDGDWLVLFLDEDHMVQDYTFELS